MLVVQQATIAIDALEGIVGRRVPRVLLIETEVVLVRLFVLELLNVSSDDDANIELDEKCNNVADDETSLFTRGEHRVTSSFFEVLVVAPKQGALGEHEVERESSQSEGE